MGTNFNEILIEIDVFSFEKMHLKTSSAKRRPFCLSRNVLTHCGLVMSCDCMDLGHHWFSYWHGAWLTSGVRPLSEMMTQHIKAWTRWLTVCRQHLKCIFLMRYYCILINILLTFLSNGSIKISQHWFRYWLGFRHGFNQAQVINSLTTGRFQRNFRKVIFQLNLVIDGWTICCKIVLQWMPMDLTEG